ncbi:hypothetical protein D3C71_1934410 [compost metagenome]
MVFVELLVSGQDLVHVPVVVGAQHDGENALALLVGGQDIEPGAHRVLDDRQRIGGFGLDFLGNHVFLRQRHGIVQGQEKIGLVGEVPVDGAAGHARFLGHFLKRGV